MDLCNPKEIKALLGRHGFHFSKSKGQNFLIQSWVPQQAAEASGAAPGVGVLEIGPGIGPLTAQLAQRGEKGAAVELKAIVTAHNQSWNVGELIKELRREHIYMNGGDRDEK